MTPSPEPRHATRHAVAAELRARLARSRVEHATLAAALGISRSAFSRKLNGERPIRPAQLAALAALLGTTADEITDTATREDSR